MLATFRSGISAADVANGHVTCFYPSVHGLDNIATFYPTATIVLVTRNATAWGHRIMNWFKIHERWQRHCEQFPKGINGSAANVDDWIEFYQNHNENIRQFARSHSSLTYIEVEMEDANSGATLDETLGITRHCWGRCIPDTVNKCIKELKAKALAVQANSSVAEAR